MKRFLCKVIIAGLLLFSGLDSFSQAHNRKTRWPVGTFHTDNADIYGLSLGIWTHRLHQRSTNTNGIKFELLGVGWAVPMAGGSAAESDSSFIEFQNKVVSERINGLNLSTTGSVCHCLTNGLQAGFIGQSGFQTNGVSVALMINDMQRSNGVMLAAFVNGAYQANGLQLSMIGNYSHKMKGVQVGLYNRSSNLTGIQIGLWNVNQKRKLPLINWSF